MRDVRDVERSHSAVIEKIPHIVVFPELAAVNEDVLSDGVDERAVTLTHIHEIYRRVPVRYGNRLLRITG